MSELFQSCYAVHPTLSMLALLLLTGWVVTAALSIALLLSAGFSFWRSGRPSNRRTAPKENMMKKRIILVVLLACGLAATSLLHGCGTLGNGQLDLPVDVEVVWQSNLGVEFTLASAQGNLYVSAKGEFYEISPDGFTITAPDGHGGSTTIRIKRRENPAQETPPL